MQSGDLKSELSTRGYRLEAALGAGGFGEVHRAVRLSDARTVAVKVMHSRGRHGSRQVQVLRKRFEREAKVLSRLDHAGCVRLLDFGALSDGTFFMVQAFIDGWTLKSVVGRDGLDPVWATRITIQVLDTLADAHRQGVVHRDIKPANIMLTRVEDQRRADLRSDVRVLDFGIAKVLDRADDDETLTEGFIGTPKFMAPEQATGQVGPFNDVYAVGILLVYLLTGQAPFTGNYVQLIDAHRSAPRPTLRDDPLGLQHIITRALAIDPADRYPDATAMKASLEVVLRRAGCSIDDIAETVADDNQASDEAPWWTGLGIPALLALALGAGIVLAMGTGDEATGAAWKEANPQTGQVAEQLDAKALIGLDRNDAALRFETIELGNDKPTPDAAMRNATPPDARVAQRPSSSRRRRKPRASKAPPAPTRERQTGKSPDLAAQFDQALSGCDCDRASVLRRQLDARSWPNPNQRGERYYLACQVSGPSRRCK